LATAFTIDNSANGGGAQTITAVAVAGTDVTLTLTPGVVSTDAPTVAYNPAQAGADPIQDVAGNAAVLLAAQPVTNNTP